MNANNQDKIRPEEEWKRCSDLMASEIRSFFLDASGSSMKKELQVFVDCPACAGTRTEGYAVKNGFPLVRCTSCGLIFANPRPRKDALLDFFSRSQAVARFSTMVDQAKQARTELIFSPLADFLQKTFPAGGKLLEVGCGPGLLLEVLAARGIWQVSGVEPSAGAVEICRRKGLNVVHGSFEDMGERGVYDLVVFWAVLDHFFDPFEAIQQAHRVLKKGGAVVIGNMNIDGFETVIMRDENFAFVPPERQNFFGIKSLSSLLTRADFGDLQIRTTGRLDVEIVRKYWAEGGKNGRNAFLESVVNGAPNLQQAFQDFLSANNLAGHMTVVARK